MKRIFLWVWMKQMNLNFKQKIHINRTWRYSIHIHGFLKFREKRKTKYFLSTSFVLNLIYENQQMFALFGNANS